jgi:hypothetical protein
VGAQGRTFPYSLFAPRDSPASIQFRAVVERSTRNPGMLRRRARKSHSRRAQRSSPPIRGAPRRKRHVEQSIFSRIGDSRRASTHRGGFFMACAGLWLGMSRVAATVRRQASFHGNMHICAISSRGVSSSAGRKDGRYSARPDTR